MSIQAEVDFKQAMQNFDRAFDLFAYMREFHSPDQATLSALRLVYKRAGQAGKALVEKLGEDFVEQS